MQVIRHSLVSDQTGAINSALFFATWLGSGIYERYSLSIHTKVLIKLFLVVVMRKDCVADIDIDIISANASDQYSSKVMKLNIVCVLCLPTDNYGEQFNWNFYCPYMLFSDC